MFSAGAEVQLGPFKANAFSLASRVTWMALPKLGLILDLGWCVDAMRAIPRAILCHHHIDHAQAAITWLCWRQPYVEREGPPQLYVPEPSLAGAKAIIEGWVAAQRYELRYELRGLRPGDRVPLEHGRVAEAFATDHHLPTLGILIKERRRRLIAALRELPEGSRVAAIKARRAAGEEVHETYEAPLLGYTSDTTPATLSRVPGLLEAQVLVTECSYVDGLFEYDPEDRSQRGERAASHSHIRPLARALEGFRGDVLALNHLPVSHAACDLHAWLLPRLPPAQRRKLVLIPYRAAPSPAPMTPTTPAPPPDPQRRWREAEALWDGKQARGRIVDSYEAWFRRQPELLDWLCAQAGALRGHCGELDLGAVIAEALARLGRRLEGADTWHIDGLRSEGYALDPSVVPFVRPEAVAPWEPPDRWGLPGSARAFWEANRT